MEDKLSWSDTEDLGLELHEAYPDVDPLTVKFTELRVLVQDLDCFEPEPGHNVNEQILEAIQAAWIEERQSDPTHGKAEDDDERSYRPNDPFRPDA